MCSERIHGYSRTSDDVCNRLEFAGRSKVRSEDERPKVRVLGEEASGASENKMFDEVFHCGRAWVRSPLVSTIDGRSPVEQKLGA